MNIPKDKRQHLAAGALVAIAIAVLSLLPLPLAAAVAAAGVGGGYELLQKYRGEGQPSWQDAAATALGGLVIAALLLAARLL